MQTATKTYRFIGRILPDGHMSIPEDLKTEAGREFEVVLTPLDDIRNTILLYRKGLIKKKGKFEDIIFTPSEIEEVRSAIYETFGTNDVDTLIDIVRKRDPLQ